MRLELPRTKRKKTAAAARAPPSPSIFAGAPETHRAPATSATTTIAVPRSWPAMMRPTSARAPGMAGMNACPQLPSRCCLRPSTVPSHTASASLPSSAGWITIPPPRWIHPVLPPWLSAKAGTSVSDCSPSARNRAGQASRRYQRAGTRVATSMKGRPSSAHRACTRNAAYGDSPSAIEVTVELDRTMTSPMTSSRAVAPTSR